MRNYFVVPAYPLLASVVSFSLIPLNLGKDFRIQLINVFIKIRCSFHQQRLSEPFLIPQRKGYEQVHVSPYYMYVQCPYIIIPVGILPTAVTTDNGKISVPRVPLSLNLSFNSLSTNIERCTPSVVDRVQIHVLINEFSVCYTRFLSLPRV